MEYTCRRMRVTFVNPNFSPRRNRDAMGDAEAVWPEIVSDAAAGRLKPFYVLGEGLPLRAVSPA
jgi:hypothetical protein